jgi:hypothetical protein
MAFLDDSKQLQDAAVVVVETGGMLKRDFRR